MTAPRASIFDDAIDVGDFAPAPRKSLAGEKEAVAEVAASRGFQSREPEPQPRAKPAPTKAAAQPRQPRRHTTGRNQQLNLKVTESALKRFYALADRHGWVLGEAFERAIDAFERQEGQGGLIQEPA